ISVRKEIKKDRRPVPQKNLIVPLVKWRSRRSSAVFSLRIRRLIRSFAELRAISAFIFSIARETSSVTWAILRLLMISLTFAGIPSVLEIASPRVTALLTTFKFVPQERQ